MEKLALLGGTPVLKNYPPKELFAWPIITEEDEAVALDVIRNNKFSGTDITEKFQNEFAAWQGTAAHVELLLELIIHRNLHEARVLSPKFSIIIS